MKKLFTLIALLAVFMGAKAEWVEDYSIDYSTKNNFPFFVMGYVPEWVDGVMTDYGANYRYATQADLDGDGDAKWKDGEESVGTAMAGSTEYQKVTGAGPYWHQYFIADGIQTELDGSYTVKAMVKASEAVTIDVSMGWGWGGGESVVANVAIGTEWAEVEWEYSGIGGTSCNLVAKPGTSTATIEWKWVKVSHNQKAQRPTVWQQWLTNDGNSIIPDVAHTNKYMGDAEFGAWPDWALEATGGLNTNWRGERTGEICAWSIVHGQNVDDDQTIDPVEGGESKSRPFPCNIEEEPGNPSNHVFVVHSTEANNEHADWQAWDNQFWIQSPQGWKEGSQIRIKFRYKAEKPCTAQTQIHTRYPSKYLHWQGIDNVSFTTEWQEFEKVVTFNGSQANGWSVAFNLNSGDGNGNGVVKEPNTFYFDDLSWETMVLDEGFFVAGSNTTTGLQYDFDNAIQFEEHAYDDDYDYVATIGEKDAYVNEIMISTVRGNDTQFKSNTLKPKSVITSSDPDNWIEYTAASLAKVALPAAGIWRVYIDTHYTNMAFEMLEGEEIVAKEPVDIVTNPTENVINGQERDWRGKDNNGNLIEEQEGSGQPWDNQFFIVANRALEKGEVTVVKFKYKASREAKASTQCHGEPGAYKHWAAIGDVNFTTEWQDFEKELTVADEADGMKSIAFNLAEIKDACIYEIKDVQWYLKDETLAEGKTWENLIDATGGANFLKKEGAGNAIEPTGINGVIYTTTGSDVIYNLSGQRVSKDYKGVVIMNGRKVVNK